MDEETAKWLLIAITVLFLILLIGVIPAIISKYKAKVKEAQSKNVLEVLYHQGEMKDKNLQIEKMLAEAKELANGLAAKQFEDWKEKELQSHREVIMEAALQRAKAILSEWKISEEKGLRKDAVTRSMGVNFGKITEHLVPFSVHLQDFDPRDIRFIGSPVDLMIFDGATSKKETIDIYFVEIKTGSGQLSKKQKTIRDAIESPFPRVHWLPIIVPEFKWDVPDDEENPPASSPSS